ncbi:MAG: ABC transporter permease [Candidatus Merdivicinus sp.]|jgi:putative aldouronate transport system permease protein
MVATKSAEKKPAKESFFQKKWKAIMREKWLYILLIPGIIYFIIFKYVPMSGVLYAFQDYMPASGLFGSPWVGLKHFQRFFASPQFGQLFVNTLVFAVLNLIFYFPYPILLALLLNEVRINWYKRTVQSLVYLPHFLSWVVIASITQQLLTTENGAVNGLLGLLGIEPIPFMLSENWLRPLILIQTMWKEGGWGTIIFLAALAGVDVSLYEAAIVDGAGHWKRLWNITIPAIKPTIVTLLILRMGSFMNTGFEQLFLMTNSMNRSVGDVFDTYVYRMGITGGQFSYSTAVGLFKSIISLILVYTANKLAERAGEEGIF